MSRIFCALLALLTYSGIAANDFTTIAPGASYAHITDKAVPWSIHVTKFDYTRPNLHLTTTLAHNTVFDLATVKQQVEALPKNIGQPICAINGDFFLIKKVPYQGDPRGLQILNGELVSGPWKDVALWIDSKGKPHMDKVKGQFKVTLPNSKTINVALNETRGDNDATLLTPTLGPTTRTTNGVDIVLQNDGGPWLPIHTGEKLSAHVVEIHNGGNATIRPDTLVLSLGPKLASRLPTLSPGSHATVNLSVSPDMKNIQTALGAGPALVKNGKNLHQPQTGKADHLRQRNPRTAIGWNDREFFMVVVDGRKNDLSLGMTFSELASLMIRLGCKEAMNLDGGGSTTMWLNGKIVNHPSDKIERHVANTLVLLQSP